MSTVEDFTELVNSLTALAVTIRENEWFSIALSITFAVAIAFMISRIINIKHKYRAKLKEKINDALYYVESDTELSFKPVWNDSSEEHANDDCGGCIHPVGSFFGTLHEGLFKGAYQMLLTAVHEFEFKKEYSEAEYTKFLTELGIRIRNKSQYRMKQNSKGLGRVIENSDTNLFSQSLFIDKLREVMDEARVLKRDETREIWKTIILPWKWRA
ncbi:MAG: hypothetical protein ACTSRU_14355 [Candidatus Hodarchaeales archaeon]